VKLRLLGGALGIALLVAHGAAQAQTVTHKLTFASGYPAAFAWTDEQVKTFLPGVNKELEKAGSKHRVEWNVAVGGTLATMPNMLDAVSTGLADMGHVVHLFEPARLPLQNVVSAAPFATDDPRLATKVLHDMQKTMPAMQKSWSNLNLVYLTSYSFDSYLLISRRPVASVTDVKGMKVAAAASNTLWLEGTGRIAGGRHHGHGLQRHEDRRLRRGHQLGAAVGRRQDVRGGPADRAHGLRRHQRLRHRVQQGELGPAAGRGPAGHPACGRRPPGGDGGAHRARDGRRLRDHAQA